MAILKCSACNLSLTKEALEAGICFNCGEKISPEILSTKMASKIMSDKSVEDDTHYKSKGNYIVCAYCESMLNEKTLDNGLCPNCGEYIDLSDLDEEAIIVIKTQEVKAQQARREKAERYKKLARMMTTGYSFDGYIIKEYLGVISGQSILGTGIISEVAADFADFFGGESEAFSKKMDAAKNAAVERLKKNALELGGNAIIGVEFDYVMFRSNMLGVVVNGTSVIVEKMLED